MITEETIKQTKFYQNEAGEHHLVTGVRNVKLVTLIDCQNGGESKILLSDDDTCTQFVPIDATFKPFLQNQVVSVQHSSRSCKPVAQSPVLSEPKSNPVIKPRKKASWKGLKKPARSNTKTTSAGDLRKGKKSKYKGVSPTKPKKNGDVRWRSFYWDGKNNKCLTIGVYDTELMAAAAYQEYTGNKAEAAKLRDQAKQQQADMVEQAENNQDRPPAKKRKKTKMIYVCKRCGLEWKSKPKECPHCGNDDFREVPVE